MSISINYGYVDLGSLRAKAKAICDCIGHGKNNKAVDMIIETAAAETGLGRVKDLTQGAGMGLTQFDKYPFDDIKKRSLRLRVKILDKLGVDIALVEWDHLRYNDFLALLFTRLHYWLNSAEIPETIEDRAKYWKKYYNTSAGKGTPEHYLEMNSIYKAE